MKLQRFISTIDSHTAGQYTRVVTGGIPPIPGKTMAEKQRYFQRNLDDIRKTLMWEPRGTGNMVGAILTDPTSDQGVAGVLFTDPVGYLSMCGHGTIGVVTTLIESGYIKEIKPITEISLDTVAGLVTARAVVDEGSGVKEVSIKNVPSFVYREEAEINFCGTQIKAYVAFGGNFYLILPASQLGLELSLQNVNRLVETGMALKAAANEQLKVVHPEEPEINEIFGVELFGEPSQQGAHAKNIMVFGSYGYDRSPCGTGTSAKVAVLYSQGKLRVGEEFIHESIIGTTFRAKILGETKVAEYDAVIPEITGSAYLTGTHQFFIDPKDPLKEGILVG